MVTAINNAPKGYKSPNYEKVRTNLLDIEQSKVQQSLNPLMQDWSIHGVSIVSDGWSNLKNQTLINIMAVSGGKAIFINGHDVSSKEKNATNIADLFFKAIEFVGPSNVVQVVTDNATNCKAARAIIQHKWDKMNMPLHCLAYILVPKYYTNSWLSKSAPGGVRRKKPYFDVEVQKGYLEAIEKMICDQIEAAVIRKQISDFVSCKGVFSQPQAVNDRATMDALSWWHLYGGAAPELYSLALKVLSQSVNTSCAERYKEDYEKFKNWDAHPEDANIEEDIMAIEERDNVSFSDSEDDITLATSDVQPCPTPTPLPTSSSFPPSTSQEHSMEQVAAQRRLEKTRGKR
ncbi:uncharacterized protein LOC114320660 [Camellia sinensis]|uniref:uncharacterized protein LOC114320660 n=1 Tax=Camellia sinensis TaxID=4442 RepID=UPI001035BC54|nr:uncharacterized protein LOC114320660 [Camellia sinensis]